MLTSGRYHAVIGTMPSGEEFCYGTASTRAAAFVIMAHAEKFDNRFYATFEVKDFPREQLGKVLGLV